MLRRLLLGACVGVLGIGAPIPASAGTIPIEFSDPQGDSGTAMDVTTVRVSNDFLGTISFQITIKGQIEVDAQDRLGIVMDTDQNSASGDVSRKGAEFSIDIDGNGAAGGVWSYQLLRWTGSSWTAAATPNSVRATSTPLDASTLSLSISINRSDVGNTVGLRFYINAVWPDSGPTDFELAPDTGTWEYKDVGTPTAAALRSAPVGARYNELKWSINDDSGGASTNIRILRVGTGTLTKTLNFGPRAEGPRTTEWLVPRRIRGYQRFCVKAIDAFLNPSAVSCKHVIFRRIRAEVHLGRTDRGTSQLWLSLSLENLPRYTYVTIDCVRGCFLHEHRTARKRTFMSRTFSGALLRDGSVIVVRVTKPRWVGFYYRMRIGTGGTITHVQRCMAPGLRTPRRVCS